jgi:hypothetical protein
LEQYQNLIEKYHTVGTVPKSNRKTKNTTLLEQYQNLIEKYHTVGTVPKSNRKTKNTTLLEQYQNLIEKQKIPHCWNSTKI